jgi:hypothetical protein
MPGTATLERQRTLAATRSLSCARFVSTMPPYGTALVTGVSFSNEPIE